MASKQITVDFILKQISDAGVVAAKKMFGEYGIYCDGKIVALVCDDQLFVKPTPAGVNYLGQVTEGLPYPGAKPWFLIASEQWNDSPWLSQLIKLSARELLPPKKKPSKRKS
jgi:TfoX/Sxy family transcriptional regulator of competence genes